MPQYKAIFVARSDGQPFTELENGRSEANAPTPEQLSKELKADPKTGTKCYDYYRRLSPKDAKHIDWRWKLGAMWAQKMGTEEMKRKILFFLPSKIVSNILQKTPQITSLPIYQNTTFSMNISRLSQMMGRLLSRQRRTRVVDTTGKMHTSMVTQQAGEKDIEAQPNLYIICSF
jgi:hypothetical protein